MTPPPVRRLRSSDGPGVVLDATPEGVGWTDLSFRVLVLGSGQTSSGETGANEIAIVPLAGAGWIAFEGQRHPVARRDVFTEKPSLAYLPPGTSYEIGADDGLEVAIGGAAASGRYPARFTGPDELASFVRGGENVARGVTVLLDPSFPSERLIAYEIVTPSGNWSSFPPHRHDGRLGTSRHEETYYYRLEPADGFAVQRMYAEDLDLDVTVTARQGDLVLVHAGYHTVATAPGTNAWYLNFLAGEGKPVTQLNDPAYDWVAADWSGRPVAIPVGGG